MKALLQDLRYGLRMLFKTPGFTVVAVVSLALGIGLNTAIFSIVNVIRIRPVPMVKEQSRVVWLRASISYPDYLDYREQTQSFAGMAAVTGTSEFSLARGGEPELIKGEFVTENYFDVLGVGALSGRTFIKEEGQTPAPVVVLSEHLWRTRFDSDSTIIGRQISINGLRFIVVGVAPKNFIGTEAGLNRELWVPLSMQPVLNPPETSRSADPFSNRFKERDSHWLAVFARLKPGVSREQAGAELTTVARHVDEAYRGKASAETLRTVQLLSMNGGMDPRDREEALPLAGIVMALKSEDAQRAGSRRSRLRAVFVTAQVTLSVVLLVGAGLFIRSLQSANTIDPGFRVERALTVPINLGLLRYKETEGENFYRDLLARVEAQPGVERASLVRFAQLGFSFAQFQVFKEGGRDKQTDEGVSTGFNVVGPNYFKTMETPLVRGRDFAETDRKGAPGVVALNETLANTLWPGEDALGKRVSLSGPEGPFLEVIGVARDGKYRSLGETPHPYIYQPLLQSYDPKMTLVVRTKGEPTSVAAAVREHLRALDANLPVADVKTLRDQLNLSLLPSRVAAWTLGGYGVLA